MIFKMGLWEMWPEKSEKGHHKAKGQGPNRANLGDEMELTLETEYIVMKASHLISMISFCREGTSLFYFTAFHTK